MMTTSRSESNVDRLPRLKLTFFPLISRLVDEWIPMDSSRLRPLTDTDPLAGTSIETIQSTPGPSTALEAVVEPRFKVNEKCMARWSDSRKFKATVKSILPNGKLLAY